MNAHAIIEELLAALFSVQPMPRLYKDDSFGLQFS
jgi:hypothetical protein